MAPSRSAFPGGSFRPPPRWFHHSASFPACLAPGPGWARAAQDGRLWGPGVGWGEGKGSASLSCLLSRQGTGADLAAVGTLAVSPGKRSFLACADIRSTVGTLLSLGGFVCLTVAPVPHSSTLFFSSWAWGTAQWPSCKRRDFPLLNRDCGLFFCN